MNTLKLPVLQGKYFKFQVKVAGLLTPIWRGKEAQKRKVKFPVCRFLLLQPGGSRECSCWNQSCREETEEEQLVAVLVPL